eukprot:14752693-Alexandrium_andersonii.AAC.1
MAQGRHELPEPPCRRRRRECARRRSLQVPPEACSPRSRRARSTQGFSAGCPGGPRSCSSALGVAEET